jgi:methionyl aminopeptidase
MSVVIKTPEEIEKMRVAGRLAAEVLDMIGPYVEPGITTEELNRICHDFIVNEQRAIPAPLNYNGFPRSICTSVNNQVCHGIPSNKRLKKGDIVNVDITVIKDGFHGDTSKMFFVGDPSSWHSAGAPNAGGDARGIAKVRPGPRCATSQGPFRNHATNEKFTVVREYCGHGIGAHSTKNLRCCIMSTGNIRTSRTSCPRHVFHHRAHDQRWASDR